MQNCRTVCCGVVEGELKKKGVVSLGQRDIPQIDCRNGKPVRTGFRIGSSSNSFLGISPMQLLHVPKL